MIKVITLSLLMFFHVALVSADCTGPLDKEINTTILACERIIPENNAELMTELDKFNGNIKSELLNDYTGFELKTEIGRLFVPDRTGISCESVIMNNIVSINIGLACCDGAPDAPCYLGYSEYVKTIKK